MKRGIVPAAAASLLALSGAAHAQGLPTTQPGLLTIYIEDIKPGHQADHARTESGWPAAFEKAGSPTHYLAMESITGDPHVWFVVPFASYAEEGADLKRNESNAELSAELTRLGRVDAEHVTRTQTIQAMARPDLSHGVFPDLTKARYWDITTFRVKPGHVQQFEAAAKLYGSLAEKNAPGEVSYRVYQVTSGMEGTTFLVFGSVDDYAQLDAMMATDAKIFGSMSKAEQAVFDTYGREAELSTVSYRYALSPTMSYVDAATKAADPVFWGMRGTR